MVADANTPRTGPAAPWPALHPGESVCWEGRPAPRCYVFRHWRHALFGLALTLVCTVWSWLGVQQAREMGWPWLVLVPLPFLAYALWLAGGQLLAARLEWHRVAYVVTDRRLLVRGGVLRARATELPLERVTWFRLQPLGEELGSLRVHGGTDDPVLLLHCIEYPRRPAALLEAAIRRKSASDR